MVNAGIPKRSYVVKAAYPRTKGDHCENQKGPFTLKSDGKGPVPGLLSMLRFPSCGRAVRVRKGWPNDCNTRRKREQNAQRRLSGI